MIYFGLSVRYYKKAYSKCSGVNLRVNNKARIGLIFIIITLISMPLLFNAIFGLKDDLMFLLVIIYPGIISIILGLIVTYVYLRKLNLVKHNNFGNRVSAMISVLGILAIVVILYLAVLGANSIANQYIEEVSPNSQRVDGGWEVEPHIVRWYRDVPGGRESPGVPISQINFSFAISQEPHVSPLSNSTPLKTILNKYDDTNTIIYYDINNDGLLNATDMIFIKDMRIGDEVLYYTFGLEIAGVDEVYITLNQYDW